MALHVGLVTSKHLFLQDVVADQRGRLKVPEGQQYVPEAPGQLQVLVLTGELVFIWVLLGFP